MPALDTNVLVRYLVADDRNQFQIAKDFIEKTVLLDALFIPVSVVVELEWVLRSLYGLDKTTMLETLNRLLETRELEFQDEQTIEIAISLYSENNADFADCLHVASVHSNEKIPLVTFDRNTSRMDGAHLLEQA